MTNLAADSPSRSLLSRIYYEKTKLRSDMHEERKFFKEGRCIFPRTLSAGAPLDMDAYLVLERNQGNLLMSTGFMMDGLARKNAIWILGKGIFDYNKVFYYSLKQKGNDQRIGFA